MNTYLKRQTINIGVIGYGYWGPNIVRNFHNTPNAAVIWVCDLNPKSLERVRGNFPAVSLTTDPNDVLSDPDVDAVAIVTPVSHHFALAKKALENGKHVFVEKPFTSSAAEAEELVELAARKKLQIMVDHTFLFSGPVLKIRELIDTDVLGTLYYYDSTRVNLGLFQRDSNVVWDLAPHDLSIMDYLIEGEPEAIVATGENHVNGVENVAFITIYFANKVIAHLNVNWLSPVKVRSTLIGAEKKMLVWNDLEADEKIKVYDRGVERSNSSDDHALRVSYRTGDLWVPRLEQVEALSRETQYFVDCIMNNHTPINDGLSGLRVVKMLEAVDRSMARRGDTVLCNPTFTKADTAGIPMGVN
ncbi:MAG TPA: Gfo/Idh/MocA family oxidoreductase [Terriglobia bacterium]|nr:Gfo/Idh/MocA family oxidoreductase [Terriglobia bacterium]